MTESGAEVGFRPDAAAWAGLAQRASARPGADARKRFRSELGLQGEGPLVMSGHQCAFWHPGILAKWLATGALAARVGGTASCSWVWVDHDDNDALGIAYPAEREGRLCRGWWRMGPAMAGVALRSRGVVRPADVPRDSAIGSGWAEGVRALMQGQEDRSDLAQQVAGAVERGLGDQRGEMRCFFARSMARTTLFESVLERMTREPEGMAKPYNAAVEANPAARVRPLRMEGSRVELPLWRVRAGMPREAVWSADLRGGAIDTSELAPRALLMTGLLRWAGCDLFVHGLGGEIYDRITEAWLSAWLGADLASSVMATATLRLPLAKGRDLPTPERLASTIARAHRARHDPALLGDEEAAREKKRLLATIEQAPRGSAARREAYAAMHAALATYRERASEGLDELKSDALAAREGLEEAEVAADRGWPWLAYPAGAIADLGAKIRGAINGG